MESAYLLAFRPFERLVYAKVPFDYITARNTTCNPNNATSTIAKPKTKTMWRASNKPEIYIESLKRGPLELWIRADHSSFQG